MKFSKKSRYGLIALIDLSVNSKTDHVALNSIAERNGLSSQYLEQIFAALRRAGIVKSVKGPQGGYLLGREAGKITVSEILEALEGDYRFESESISEDSKNVGISITIQQLVIDKVNQELENILTNLTLADLEREYQEHNAYSQDMYYI